MLKSYKFRLCPTEAQKVLMEKHFGVCRLVYNLALETKIMAYRDYQVNVSRFELQKQLADLRKEFPWLKEVSSKAARSSLINLEGSFNSLFRGNGFPRFKSKRSRHSFQLPEGNKIRDGKLVMLKFQEGVKIVITREIEGLIRYVTVSKSSTGKYFASITVKIHQELPRKPKVSHAIGVDLGLKSFMITDNGEIVENPKQLRKAMNRLKVLQNRASKKIKGSKNQRKAFDRFAKLHEKIANQRLDFLHKVSTKLVRDNQADTICMEDLAVKNMIKNHKLAQAISDVSWGKFLELVKYKCDWYGKNLILVNRFYPSSKTCNVCGVINQDLKLSDRAWACGCGITHDRDINAAINIRNSGTGCAVEPVELPTVVGAKKQEKKY